MGQLFRKLRINNTHTVMNRLAVAPMTTTQSNADGTISEAEIHWLERLAKEQYGLIITCAAAISKQSIAFPNQLSIGDDGKLEGLQRLADRLKSFGSKTIIQLCHGGSRTIPELSGTHPLSASNYSLPGIPDFVPPETLSVAQIKEIVSDFANACERVAKAGFAGIEFHGANGYLFTQFTSTMTNQREDEYGGNLENRARFSREVVQACREKVPENFILGFRMSFENMGMETGLDIDENIRIANWLAEDGIDYLHISHLVYDAPSIKYPEEIALCYIRNGINPELPLICAGSIDSVEAAEKALEYGADMVAIGRAAIGNSNIPEMFEKGTPLTFKTPFSESELVKRGISPEFLSYIKNAPPLKSLKIIQQ